jgi:hypothetical protein
LPAAFGELLLVLEQELLVDRDTTFAPLRDTARLDDAASFVLSARSVSRRDFDAL